ncbi:MAG: FkbM family methyltransferase [bacterium]|nr:FkbM family methyltransferase [bacterium]
MAITIVENFSHRHPRATRVLETLVPPLVQGGIRKRVFEQNAKTEAPFPITVNGREARFSIRNFSDWYRIAGEGFESVFLGEVLNNLQSGDIFVDVGSAQGLYAVMAAKTGAEVYAVDPDPVSLQSIKENLALNSDISDSVHVLNVALGDKDGREHFYVDPKGMYAPSLRRTTRCLKETVEVDVRSLDSLITAGSIKHPDVIKVDVEGADGRVLAGMQKTLTSPHRPRHLFIELHPVYLPQFGTSTGAVLQQISDIGYVPVAEIATRSYESQYHFVPV